MAPSLLFFAVLGLIVHVSGQAWLGFALMPFPMLLSRQDGFRFMLFLLAGYLLFFEAYRVESNFLCFNVPDSLALVFVFLAAFSTGNPLVRSLSVSRLTLALYAFIAYGLALSILPLMERGCTLYLLRDAKNLLFLGLPVFLCGKDEALFRPRNLYRILSAVVAFSALHTAVVLWGFFATGARVITWNEIFFSDSILVAMMLLRVTRARRARLLLYAGLCANLLGLLATQTRGLWLSTAISACVYALLRLRRSRALKARPLLKAAAAAALCALGFEAALRVSQGRGLAGFVIARMAAVEPGEFINPYSSLGYRLHESAVVWENRTWFGHGSGATLHLFFTQLGMSRFLDWWSIHSQYFEILHKYGFVGLGLFLALFATLLRRSYRIARDGRAFTAAMGSVALITILNHMLVSVTSGYLFRANVIPYIVLMVGTVERLYPRTRPPR